MSPVGGARGAFLGRVRGIQPFDNCLLNGACGEGAWRGARSSERFNERVTPRGATDA